VELRLIREGLNSSRGLVSV